jgi:hypothetical protein
LVNELLVIKLLVPKLITNNSITNNFQNSPIFYLTVVSNNFNPLFVRRCLHSPSFAAGREVYVLTDAR